MKLTISAVLCLIGSVGAFAPMPVLSRAQTTGLFMSVDGEDRRSFMTKVRIETCSFFCTETD